MKRILISLAFLFVFAASVLAQVWVPVGSAGFSVGIPVHISIAIDGSGIPYVAYSEGNSVIKATVMKYNGEDWVTVGTAGFSVSTARFISIAIDGSGIPYVVYADDAYSDKAVVKKYNGTDWVTVGSAGFSAGTANYTSIAIDGNGIPYVVYWDGGNSAKATVMKYNDADWEPVGTAGFSDGAAFYTSIAIDGSGIPYVVYDESFGSGITVKKFNSTNWETVGSAGFSAGDYTSIAIDGSGIPYVVYSDNANSERATVMKYNGTDWVTVGSAGFSLGTADNTSIAIDESGIPYVAYEDYDNLRKATVMKYNGTDWVTVGPAGFSADYANYISIAVDGSGTPYVAYWDGGNSDKATVMKLVPDQPPIADAGTDQTVIVTETVELDGSGSSDQDADPLTYSWSFLSKPAGSSAELSSTTNVNPNFAPDLAGDYVIQLVVNDGIVNSSPDQVTIIALSPQEANEAFIEQIEGMEISHGIENSLTSKLESAIVSLEKGNNTATLNQLNSFINQVEAQRGKELTDEQANQLIAEAQRIIDAINSSSLPKQLVETITKNGVPLAYDLEQNYPNPFNPTTRIRFGIPEAGNVTLKIYNSVGQLVKTLVDGNMSEGYHQVTWDAIDNSGNKLSSGVYFYRIIAGTFTQVNKMMLLR